MKQLCDYSADEISAMPVAEFVELVRVEVVELAFAIRRKKYTNGIVVSDSEIDNWEIVKDEMSTLQYETQQLERIFYDLNCVYA